MAQSILNLGRREANPSSASPGVVTPRRRHLGTEKLGVIGGFLVGLPVGVGLVGEPLSAFGAPQWLVVAMTGVVVAVFTRIGLSLGHATDDPDAD